MQLGTNALETGPLLDVMVRAPTAYDPEPDESVSTTVIRALADTREECPAEMTPRLYEVLDPDALDRLFESGGGGTDGSGPRVSFSFGDYRVVVDGSRRVFVSEHDGSAAGENPVVLRGAGSPWRLVSNRS